MPATDNDKMLTTLADNMVANSITRVKVEAMVDDAIASGDLVASARGDVMLQLGKTALRDGGKIITGEAYITKDNIERPAGQDFALALKEWIEARPHVSGRKPEPTDMEALAFEKGSARRLFARGELVKTLGEAGANERAIAWGLKGIHDYSSEAVKPDPNGTAANKSKTEKIKGARKDNPWMYGNATPEEFGDFIRAKGPAAALEAARKAGKTIGGQPLRRAG